MMKKRFEIILLFVFILIVNTKAVSDSFLNPPWCDKNYSWDKKKGISKIGSKIVAKEVVEKAEYHKTYAKTVVDFYSRASSDTIIEYNGVNGDKKRLVIKGKRTSNDLYSFLTSDILNSNIELYNYMSCNKQFNEPNLNTHEQTRITMLLPYGSGTITRFGTKYAKAHNLSLLMSYYMKSATSIGDYATKDADKFTKAYTKYLLEASTGKIPILFREIQNAKDNYELLKIVSDEVFSLLKVIGESQDANTRIVIDFADKFRTTYNKWEGERDKDTVSKVNVVKDIKSDLLKIFHKNNKKGLDAIIKYTGLEGYLKGTESAVNFIIASTILTEMVKESGKAANTLQNNSFSDVPYDPASLSSLAVYTLLENLSISSPNSDRSYKFYPNVYITAKSAAIILVNEFLFDDFMLYNENRDYKLTKLVYLTSIIQGKNIILDSNDTVLTNQLDGFLKDILKYNFDKIIESKYSNHKDKAKNKKFILELLKKDRLGLITHKLHGGVLTRSEFVSAVFLTGNKSLEDIVDKKFNKPEYGVGHSIEVFDFSNYTYTPKKPEPKVETLIFTADF